jgi:predicted transposase/invertase (TIGR01784 family)
MTANAFFIDILSDFGFKKIFGEEPNKIILIGFLNSLLPEHHQVQDVSYTKNEYQGPASDDRKAIFDIKCVSTRGEHFIVELQKAKQIYFKERMIYYSTFPVQEQAHKSPWNFNLQPVYTIAILNFVLPEDSSQQAVRRFEGAPVLPKKVMHEVKLREADGTVFSDKLNFIYFTLPNFDKKEEELESNIDKWMYLFKNLPDLRKAPQGFIEEHFLRLFEIAEVANMTPAERAGYNEQIKIENDNYNTRKTELDEAHNMGWAEGIAAGIAEGLAQGVEAGKAEGERQAKHAMALQLKDMGMTEAEIFKITGIQGL